MDMLAWCFMDIVDKTNMQLDVDVKVCMENYI